jgi:UDP-N-acetylglucosamine/UDP-N-acetylgalactosamine diphosphorylase
VLSIMKERGISYVHCYGVDNCLVRVADPTFIGYNLALEAECGAKVVPKTEPTESVGVVARKAGAYGVVEYTELPAAQAALRDADGQLAFRAANIANHFYSTAFLDRVASFEAQMAYHIARKKIPTVDLATGAPLKPATPNGMKLEMFVFDVFPFAERFAVLEVERAEEFSPLKNGPGSTTDNQQTSRADLLAQQRRWLERAGARVEGAAVGELELGPLVTYAGEGLEALDGVVFTKGGVLDGLAAEDLARFT